MTIGEKIRTFRNIKKMSRKVLAERSGVSEISIRKYEEGTRNPKPAQLKKIAQAFGISETVLLEIPLNKLSIETVGDVMSLLFLLESKVGYSYVFALSEDGTINTNTITIRFENKTINDYLARLISETMVAQSRAKAIMDSQELPSDEINRQNDLASIVLELSKQEFMESTEPLRSKQ